MSEDRNRSEDIPYAFLYSSGAQTVNGATVGGDSANVYQNFVFTTAVTSRNVKTFGTINGIIIPQDGIYEATYIVDGPGETLFVDPPALGPTFGPVVALLLTTKHNQSFVVPGSVNDNSLAGANVVGNVIFKAKRGDQLQLVNDSIFPVVLAAGTTAVSLDVPNNVQLTVTLVKKR